ncbi:nuclear transport factor 2 family protein [Rhizobium sp. TH2]|uniref:nuclear transport factor 2 family protein n=1 Tax=Rhizobium sp. TH2 TaxID=2775403 RepID=UPI0021587ACA|nr:nuclear transport factor 2 family protein [Rhizobium sp. TH2]UVC08252.1 nuclear transport factor 2 family protein [Rhizobium sp. TH2]
MKLRLFASAVAVATALSTLPALADEATEAANLQLVTTAYQTLFGDHDMTALEKYFREDYIQHNPMAPPGRAGLKKFLTDIGIEKGPKTTLTYLRTAADGDLVWLYSTSNFGQGDMAVIDIFRVQDGMIAEHWDVMQAVPATTASGNSFSGDLK